MISIAMLPLNQLSVVAVGVADTAIDGVAFVLGFTAVAMLFRSDAKAWLGKKGNHQTSI